MSAVKIWNGSAFVDPSALKIWNGSAFADPSGAYVWTGSAFEKVWPILTGPPVFDAVGGGNKATNFSSAPTATWSHTAAAGAYVVATVINQAGTAPTMTYGAQSMTQLGSLAMTGSVPGTLYLFGVSNVAGGAQTVTLAAAAPDVIQGNTISVTGVSSVGTPASVALNIRAMTQSVSCTAGQLIVQSFGALNSGIASHSGGTFLWGDIATGSNLDQTLSYATATTTFAATMGSKLPGGAISVVLS